MLVCQASRGRCWQRASLALAGGDIRHMGGSATQLKGLCWRREDGAGRWAPLLPWRGLASGMRFDRGCAPFLHHSEQGGGSVTLPHLTGAPRLFRNAITAPHSCHASPLLSLTTL